MSKQKKVLFLSLSLLLVVLITVTSAPVPARVDAARPASASCSVDVLYVKTAQGGDVLNTELYHKDFVVQEGVDFVDNYSTTTRFKRFTASLQRVEGETVVSINWFADVSVFDSVDFSTKLTLDGRKPGTVSADHTFSSTPGHASTTYVLEGVRN